MTKEQIEKLGITYVEGMTDEDVIAKINEKTKEADDKFAEMEKKANSFKANFDKVSTEVATLKKEKQAQLSEDEKAKLHNQELEDEIKALKQENAKNAKINAYKDIGYSAELASKIAEAELKGEDTTALHKEFLTAHDEEVKKEVMKQNPNPKGLKGAPKNYTKEMFKNNEIPYEELVRLQEEQPEVYKEITAE